MEQEFNKGEKPVCDQFLSYNGQWHRDRCWDEEWASLSLVSLSESADSSLGDGCQLELVLISSHFTQRHSLLSQHLVRNPTPSSSLTLFSFHFHYKWPFSLWAVTLCLSICKSKHPLYKKFFRRPSEFMKLYTAYVNSSKQSFCNLSIRVPPSLYLSALKVHSL